MMDDGSKSSDHKAKPKKVRKMKPKSVKATSEGGAAGGEPDLGEIWDVVG